jgi:hypothetical protein
MLLLQLLIWLVVSTPLKNISQLRSLFPIYGKIKHVPVTTNQIIYNSLVESPRFAFLKILNQKRVQELEPGTMLLSSKTSYKRWCTLDAPRVN